MSRYIRVVRVITYEGEEEQVLACIAKSIHPGAPRRAVGYTISAAPPQVEEIVRPPNVRMVAEDIAALRAELLRLADICDTQATLADGSSPDTRWARHLLGD